MKKSDFWQGKRVFITGNTGFKGSWLTLLLIFLGAKVAGYSLKPPTEKNLYEVANVSDYLEDYEEADIGDTERLKSSLQRFAPDIMLHLAAQPLVRQSYLEPIETYRTNVLGTASVLEAARYCQALKAVLIITTDKCYENKESLWGYRENDALGGFDPYSNSKACAELVVNAFRDSFFNVQDFSIHNKVIMSARAGNVIGGGDWAKDRLVPDILESFAKKEKVQIRNPWAIRPWQHVLEPLSGYLKLLEKAFLNGTEFSGAWNFASNEEDAQSVEWIAKKMQTIWQEESGEIVAGLGYKKIKEIKKMHETNYLKLDYTKARLLLGWQPKWNLTKALEKTVYWYQAYLKGANMQQVTLAQVEDYML